MKKRSTASRLLSMKRLVFVLASTVLDQSTAAVDTTSSAGSSQPVTFGYTLYTTPDSVSSQVKGVEKSVRTSLRKLVGNSTDVGRATNLTSTYDDSNAQGNCSSPNNVTLPTPWKCYDVNMTFALPLDDDMDALVVRQAALGLVQTILQEYNAQNFDQAFVAYREPKFVDSMLRVFAVGLTSSIMNNAQQQLFLQVFHQGFDSMLASPASDVPMNVVQAKVLYQIEPLAVPSADASSTGQGFRTKLDPNSTTSDTSNDAPLTSNVAVHMMVRATCAGPECHDDTFARALWDKVGQHADAWATGIHQQAEKSTNSALRNYFAPLTTIVLESRTSLLGDAATGSYRTSSMAHRDVYHPASEVDHDNYGVPTWLWIVLGVDGGILLASLLVAYCRVAKRRKEFAGDHSGRRKDRAMSTEAAAKPSWSRPYQEEPIPEQYPYKEPYPNLAGLKEVAGAGSSHHSDDEFHNEGSDRVFDDGIHVREAQEDSARMDNFDDEQDESERIFDDGIRVREVQVDSDSGDPDGIRTPPPPPREAPPPPQEAPPPPPPPPPPSPTPPEERPYDDGIRVTLEDAGETSRLHDDGIHISNSIHDID